MNEKKNRIPIETRKSFLTGKTDEKRKKKESEKLFIQLSNFPQETSNKDGKFGGATKLFPLTKMAFSIALRFQSTGKFKYNKIQSDKADCLLESNKKIIIV